MRLPDRVVRQIAAIESLVDERAWSDVEAIVGALPGLIEALPEADRKPALLALRSFLDDLEKRIQSASAAVADELGTLRAGRRAADRYRACARALSPFDVTQDM